MTLNFPVACNRIFLTWDRRWPRDDCRIKSFDLFFVWQLLTTRIKSGKTRELFSLVNWFTWRHLDTSLVLRSTSNVFAHFESRLSCMISPKWCIVRSHSSKIFDTLFLNQKWCGSAGRVLYLMLLKFDSLNRLRIVECWRQPNTTRNWSYCGIHKIWLSFSSSSFYTTKLTLPSNESTSENCIVAVDFSF